MQKIFTLLSFILLFGCAAQKYSLEKGWISLFNGKDLDDWIVKIKDHPVNENFGNTFRVEDGVIKVRYDQYEGFKQQYGHLFYKNEFSAYLLELEYRFVGDQIKDGEGWALRNSGVMLHGQDPKTMAVEQDFHISLDAQFLGGLGTGDRSTGNLCTPGTNVIMNDQLFTPHCVSSNSKTYHGEQWVKAGALVLKDSIVKHIINGDTVLVFTKPQYDGRDPWVKKLGKADGGLISKGTISLQSESHPVEFRNVRLFNLEKYLDDPQKLNAVLNRLQSAAGKEK